MENISIINWHLNINYGCYKYCSDEIKKNTLCGKDACGITNPKQATHEEIAQIFRNAL